MKIAIYSTKQYEQSLFERENSNSSLILKFITEPLSKETASLCADCEAVCCFVTDQLDAEVLNELAKQNIKLIALRSAGYDHVDLPAAQALGITVVRVPAYSPNAIAEFAVGLILTLSRKITQENERVHAHNFSLEGQVGFNIHGKTIGVIGTGNIGTVFIRIMSGFGCKILAYDPKPNEACKQFGASYTTLENIFKQADIISLHCLLNEDTQHVINQNSLALMKQGVMLINTSRGGLIDTEAVIKALEAGKIGALGIDVYEYERFLFFVDHSQDLIEDKLFLRLESFSNVLITGHQAYLTQEALHSITKTTLENIVAFEEGKPKNVIKL